MAQHVDSLIVIPNDKLMLVLGNDISMLDAFKAANDVLYGAVAGIAEVINCPGLVNVDLPMLKQLCRKWDGNDGFSIAMGVDRARVAAERAVSSPLLEEIFDWSARNIRNITASQSLKMREVHEVMNTIKDLSAEDATIIVGTVIDEDMAIICATLVATGLSVANQGQGQSSPLTVVHTVPEPMTEIQFFYRRTCRHADRSKE